MPTNDPKNEPDRPMRMDEVGPLGQGTVTGRAIPTSPAPEILKGSSRPSPVHSLANLLDRLEELETQHSELHKHLIAINDQLGGPIPQPTANEPQASGPTSMIGVAHHILDRLFAQTGDFSSELKRLDTIKG